MIMVYLQALKERDPKRAVAEGESIRALAEGEAAAKKLQADADLYVRMKEAEGERGPWLCSLSTVYCHWSCKEVLRAHVSGVGKATQGQWGDWMACTRLSTVLLL